MKVCKKCGEEVDAKQTWLHVCPNLSESVRTAGYVPFSSLEKASYDIALHAHYNKYGGDFRKLMEFVEEKIEEYISVNYEST